MNPRFVAWVGALAFCVVVVSPVPRAQTRTSPARAGSTTRPYTAPRTPDGQPDLQGFWTNSTYTPLERPNNVTKVVVC